MEDEMDHLAANMAEITEFSARISDTLQDRRQQITQLSGVHTLLKKVAICVSVFYINNSTKLDTPHCRLYQPL